MIKYTTTDATSYDGDKARVWFIDESRQWPHNRNIGAMKNKDWRDYFAVPVKQADAVARLRVIGEKRRRFPAAKLKITSVTGKSFTVSLIK